MTCPYCGEVDCSHLIYVRNDDFAWVRGLVKTVDKKFIECFEKILRKLAEKDIVTVIDGNTFRAYAEFDPLEIFRMDEAKEIKSNLAALPVFSPFPNPYLEEFIQKNLKENKSYSNKNYSKEPFTADLKAGKNTPIYNAHSYHTKVPPQGIEELIEHYTELGDLILDPFAGSGMTGVAALAKGRKAILVELSPSANFIAYNYCTPIDLKKFEEEAKRILNRVKKEMDWLYETKCRVCGSKARIEYVIWSDVFEHPEVICKGTFRLWDAAVDEEEGKVRREFECPKCGNKVKKTNLKRIGTEPVKVNYTCFNCKSSKKGRRDEVNEFDSEKIKEIERRWKRIYEEKLPPDTDDGFWPVREDGSPLWFPNFPYMFKGEKWGDTWRAGYHEGITHVYHFYTIRNLWALARLWDEINKIRDERIRKVFQFVISSFNPSFISRLTRYNFGKRGNSPLSGTLYVPSFTVERNLLSIFKRKISDIKKGLQEVKSSGEVIITTQSATNLSNIPDNSIDYIFTDPPYADNLMYSELNFIWEAWLGYFTDNTYEAIENKVQGKSLKEYKKLMAESFKEMYRVLKPYRYLTLAFNNRKDNVFRAIIDALHEAGFVVVGTHLFDSKQRSFKGVKYGKAAKGYVIINCIKPKEPNNGIISKKPTIEEIVSLIHERLRSLPKNLNEGRTIDMLWNGLVAKLIEKGYLITLSKDDFIKLLQGNENKKFKVIEDEGVKYYFAPDEEIREGISLISSEEEAVKWLDKFLSEPKSFGEIAQKFRSRINPAKSHELQVQMILDKYFVYDEKTNTYSKPVSKKDRMKILERFNKNRFEHFKRWMKRVLENSIVDELISEEDIVFGFSEMMKRKMFKEVLRLYALLPNDLKKNKKINQAYLIAEANISEDATIRKQKLGQVSLKEF